MNHLQQIDAEARHVLMCHGLRDNPLPPGPGASLGECNNCDQPVWVGPGHRQVITEFEVRGTPYETRCLDCEPICECGRRHRLDAGNEADTMRMMRGVMPRRELVLVTMSELAIIRREMPDIFRLSLRWD